MTRSTSSSSRGGPGVLRRAGPRNWATPPELPDISPKWPAMTKPVIGAINNAAVTGGLNWRCTATS